MWKNVIRDSKWERFFEISSNRKSFQSGTDIQLFPSIVSIHSVSNHVPESNGKLFGASVLCSCGMWIKKLQQKKSVEIEIEHFNHSRCYPPIFTINVWTNSNLAHKLIPLMQLCIQSIFINFRNSLLAKNSISILNVFPILCNLPSNLQLFHPFRIESLSPYIRYKVTDNAPSIWNAISIQFDYIIIWMPSWSYRCTGAQWYVKPSYETASERNKNCIKNITVIKRLSTNRFVKIQFEFRNTISCLYRT